MSVNASGKYYPAKHAASYPFLAGGGARNLNSVQFGGGKRASGNVIKGFNPFTYEGGAHRKPGRMG